MELKWFEDFLSVARCYSFTRAANERHITQSALSRRIRQLEEWLGVPLFDRKTYPVTLTPEGQTFLATASETVFSMTHLRNDLHQRYSSRTAVLRFAMLNTLSLTFFPDWIQRLNLQPHLSYIRLCNQKPSFVEHISTLHSGETDFLLTYANDAVSLIHQLAAYPMIQLGRERAIAVCRPDSSGKPLYPVRADGGPIPWLSYGQHTFFAHALAQMLSKRPLPLEAVYENGMSVNLKAMVLAGAGVAWLPLSLIHEELASGNLVRADESSWDISLAIRLYRQPVLQNPQAEQLWLRACASDTADAA
ncbi:MULTISPECIES: LysR family transcriptional regulator [unclassified Pantoea]|uniref:LysR family transcriptional regulator n=1 Tax=unclassified Pantoea TaxID=2630326 RepID=UPI0021576226|nr:MULTISPECIES: LysR family transcriptional regulator [unclassified Pantoea]MEA5101262.1 LysR family transcriptional regulator [Pantoea sp. S18]UVC31468.1 LysR family transcriptional regulator [Pantoea sp. SOD02]